MWKGSNMTNTGYLKSDRKNDSLYTPYHIIDHITKYLPTDKIIWCPFDEKWSAFTVRLKERGYNVVSSHINDGQDFFNYEPAHWDIIVSNPPFSLKDRILGRLYSFNKPFATAYFCRYLLPKDLIIEKLVTYERPLVKN